MKNCGAPIHEEVATKTLMEDLREFLKNSNNEKVRDQLCAMLQVWSHAFRNEPKYRAVQVITYNFRFFRKGLLLEVLRCAE